MCFAHKICKIQENRKGKQKNDMLDRTILAVKKGNKNGKKKSSRMAALI